MFSNRRKPPHHHHAALLASESPNAPPIEFKKKLGDRYVNLRFGLAIVVVVFLALGGVSSVHKLQASSLAIRYKSLGESLDQRGNMELADAYWSRYLDSFPNDVEILERLWLSRAAIASTDSQKKRAYKALFRVSILDPNRQRTRRVLARLSFELGNFREAVTHVSGLWMSGPSFDLSLLQAKCYEALAEFEASANAYRRCCQLNTGNLEIRNKLATILFEELDLPNEADQVLTKFLDDNPDNLGGWLVRARLRSRMNRPDEAVLDTQRALSLNPSNLEANLLFAEIVRDETKPEHVDAVLTTLQKLLASHNDEHRIYRALARLAAITNLDSAIGYLTRGLEAAPDQNTRLELVRMLVKAKRFEQARKESELLSSGWRTVFQAQMLREERNYQQAMRTLDGLDNIRAEPVSIQAKYFEELAKCHHELQEWSREIRAYQRVIDLNVLTPKERAVIDDAIRSAATRLVSP